MHSTQTIPFAFRVSVFFIVLPSILSSQTASLVFPKDGIVTAETSVFFEWNSIPNAAGYKIQIDLNDPLFNPPLTKDTSGNFTAYTKTLPSGKYYWRVSANTGSGFTAWSPVWSFRVFSPDDLNATTWYKADSGVHLDQNGKVDSLPDASGNNNTALQIVDADYRPSYSPSVAKINNKPLFVFDGNNDYLDFRFDLTQIRTVFWVVREDSFASARYRSLLGDNAVQPYFHRGCCDDGFPGTQRYIYDGPVTRQGEYCDTSVVNGTTRLNGAVIDPTRTDMPKTMSIINTRTSSPARASNFSYDGRSVVAAEFRVWDGELAELIIYNTPLDSNNIKIVEEYLHYKYAPPANLGADIIRAYRLCDTVVPRLNYYSQYTWYKDNQPVPIQIGGDSLRITVPGIYSVEVRDIFGRITRDSIVVQFARPHILNDTTICAGSSLVWNTGLSNDYTFMWQDGSTGSSYTISGAGDYWVQVSDSFGCTFVTDTVHVDIDSFNITASLGADDTICRYQRIGLVSGTAEATEYNWSTGDTTSEIVISSSGTYALTVQDAGGCVATDTINLTIGPEAPIVNFTTPDVCLGITTNFTDSSTNASSQNIAWQWDFGDGFTSTDRHPSHKYSAPGSYRVKLTVTSANLCTNDITKTVKVFSLPQALFTDTIFCAGIPRHLIDRSTSAVPIVSWHWGFGDATTATQQNPVHQYDSIGLYTVELRVTDTNACADTFTTTIECVQSVAPAVTPSLILPKDNVTFSDTSILFDWNPSAGAEYYTLQIATSPGFTNVIFTTDVTTDSVIVSSVPFSTSFYYWQVLAVNLCGTISPSAVQRFQLFRPDIISDNCLWLSADYGLGPFDINGNVTRWKDRSPAGNDAVPPSALDEHPGFIPTVRVLNGKPVLSFNKLNGGSNGVGQYVQFNMIDSIRTVFWVIKEDSNATPFYRHVLGNSLRQPDFHRDCCDNNQFPGTTKNIFGLFAAAEVLTGQTWLNSRPINATSTPAPTQYSILSHRTTGPAEANCFVCDRTDIPNSPTANDNRFWWGDLAELIIYCQPLSDTLIQTVESYLRNKYAPPVNLGPDIARGYNLCDPVVLRAGDHFVKYNWDVPGMSNIPDTVKTINFFGSGTVRVTATDVFGFLSTDEMVVTGGLQNPFDDTVFICLGNDTVWNTQLSYAYDFQWQDGTTDSFIMMNEEKHYWVEVTDTTPARCKVRDSVFVNIDSFSVQAALGGDDTLLCSGNRIGLIAKAEETISYRWSTGDTVPIISVSSPQVYSLTAVNIHQCVAHDSVDVDIFGNAPITDFSFSRICRNDTTRFIDGTTPADIVSWLWDFDDGTYDTLQHPPHYYQDTGTYRVKLTVRDSEGCLQDVTKPVVIYALPVTRFSRDLVNCANDFVEFKDISAAANQSIDTWYWTFGDGSFDIIPNPFHRYSSEGIYPVSLEVTTDRGCKGAAFDTIEIFPELIIGFRAENLCVQNNSLTCFFDTSPGFSNVYWYWEFGDNGYSFKQNPCHSYLEKGTYIVSLRVKNALGCEKTIQQPITLTVPPIANFHNPDLCENTSFRFTDNTVTNGGDNVVSWSWNFGDGSTSTLQHPTHVYTRDSVYNVRLNVVTRNGCISSVIKPVEVIAPPVADFDFHPKFGAAPLIVTFTNQSAGASSYIWDFGDNSPASGDENPVHTYLQNGRYVITLIVSSLPGCSDTAVQSINVVIPILDIGIDRILLSRLANHGECLLDVKAVITNYGTVDVTSFDIRANSSEGGIIEDHWTGAFPDNRTLTYPFSVQFVLQDCEDAVICLDVARPNGQQDQTSANDHLCASLSDDFVIIGPYPNPAGDFIHLDMMLPAGGIMKITNYNSIGQRLGKTEMRAEKGYLPLTIETKPFPAGVYFLRIEYLDDEWVREYVVR